MKNTNIKKNDNLQLKIPADTWKKYQMIVADKGACSQKTSTPQK